jgi:hypothetical protein
VVGPGDREADRRRDRRASLGHDGELERGEADVAAVDPEDLTDHAQLKRSDTGKRESSH